MISHHYKVGDQIFESKIDAVYFASKTNQDVEWYFHDDAHKKANWRQEPDESLDELYKRRAQQIREQYDYVVCLVSGGADSRNVIYSFLNNGIKVDEVIGSVPLEGTKNYQFNNTDTRHLNTVSETVYAQLPLLEEIRKNFPQTKVTVHDYFQDLIDFKTDDWLIRCGEWLHPSSAARYSFDRITHLKKLAESGKRIAFVYGIDKPLLCVSNREGRNYVITIYADLAVNVQRPPFTEDFPNVENVAFYWYEDPTIVIKQSHILLNNVLKTQHPISSLFSTRPTTETSFEMRKRHGKYERAIVPYIYPTTFTPTFQAEKPENVFLGEHDYWLYSLHSNTRITEMVKSDTQNFTKSIKDKFFSQQKNGLKPFIKWYAIGELD